MESDFVGPPLPPHISQGSEAEHSALSSNQADQLVVKPKKHAEKGKHKSQAEYFTSSSFAEDSNQSVQVQKSSKSKGASSSQQGKSKPDPVHFREVDVSDLPCQYTEDIETFRQILNLPDPRESMSRASTTLWALNKVAKIPKAKSEKVPTHKKQPGMGMKRPVTTWTS